MSDVKTKLEYAATMAMLVASAILVYAALRQPSRKAGFELPGYRVGERFDVPQVSSSGDSRPLVVFYLRTDCEFCQLSLDFYRRLRAKASNARFVVIGLEPVAVLQEHYVVQNGLAVDAVVTIDRGTTRLIGTPTVLLLDSDLIIKGSWRGLLDSTSERVIWDSLR